LTTRLGNIIQMISLARQSGILRVIRGHGPTREIGQIQFVDGEPITALLGQVVGQGALNILANWGECLYAFDEGPQMGAYSSGSGWSSTDPAGPGAGSPAPMSGYTSGSWPSYGYGMSAPSSPMAPTPSYGGPGSPPPSTSSALPPMAPPGAMPGTPGYGYGGQHTGPLNPYGDSEADIEALLARRIPGAPPAVAPAPTLRGAPPERPDAVPVRTAISEHVDQLPLDRRERMVLLLVDGQRTTTDLIRLVRRSEREVLAVLQHLRMLGLIEFRR
ncbi:MAG TPA: hypothetical protein VFY89_00820, partial [Ktedonobacterales bacterium]